MGRSRRREAAKAVARRTPGTFVPMPHAFLWSTACSMLSRSACKLLLDLCSQYNLNNNGDLCAAWTVMKRRGWKSRDTLSKALKELEGKDIILRTRQGGINKASLYALAFFAIDECSRKLDVPATSSPSPKWHRNGELLAGPPLKIKSPNGAASARTKNTKSSTESMPANEELGVAA